ncbi:MAG TPA: hypothetical protein VN408_15800 [Actinoplanes sp.]|nr:hypothetical protein [Actinoplanes sp.]
MTTCDNCGSPVTPGDAFCGVCGTYLDWNSPAPSPATPSAATLPAEGPADPVPAPATSSAGPADPGSAAARTTGSPAPAATVEETATVEESSAGAGRPAPHQDGRLAAEAGSADRDEAEAGHSDREKSEPDQDHRATPDDAESEPDQDHRATPDDAETEPDRPEPAAEQVLAETESDRRKRAAALVVPVSEAGPAVAVPARDVVMDTIGRDRPGAVQPGRPVAPRPVLREFADEQTAGQLVCPHCDTANPPDRVFCRRCGRSLAGAVAQGKDRRKWRFRWPRGRGRLWRLLAFLLILALLVGAGWAAAHWGPRAVDAVLDRLATAEATTPNATSASSSARSHGPGLVADGLSNRYWSPTSGRGAGEWVELRFDVPIRVLDVIISGGVSPDQAEYLQRGRPADVMVSTWTSGEVRTDHRFRLADRAGPQHFAVTAGDTTRLRVTIESGYALGPGRAPAIAEIEVFRRP